MTTADVCPEGVPTATLAGQVITGGSESTTMTLKTQAAEFEDESVAVQVTNVVPRGKRDPVCGEHCTAVPGQLSVAVAGG